MWYVAQVQAGRESSTLEMCRRLVPPSVMEDCFMPEYEVMWKIRGEWRLVKRLLFPGYLFFVTDDPEALNRELSRVPMPIRLLGNEENSFFPLTGKERDWFLSFMDGNHTVRMSEGYISGDKITVTRGPRSWASRATSARSTATSVAPTSTSACSVVPSPPASVWKS